MDGQAGNVPPSPFATHTLFILFLYAKFTPTHTHAHTNTHTRPQNFDVIESGGDEEGTAVFVDAWRGLTFEVDAATGLVTTLVVVSAAEA